MNRESIKRFIPTPLIDLRRRWLASRRRAAEIRAIPPEARRLYRASLQTYDTALSSDDENARRLVIAAARRIEGERWNDYSDALRPEIVDGFRRSIDALPRSSVRYLEIGSNRGLSMAAIALLIRQSRSIASLTSVDPYFEAGYVEGALSPYAVAKSVAIDKRTRDAAFVLYREFDLGVELIETTSDRALLDLIAAKRQFDLIYIDGSHERFAPLTDLALSLKLLADGGVVILDDHAWPDVAPLKLLCDRHLRRVWETWKTAAYVV